MPFWGAKCTGDDLLGETLPPPDVAVRQSLDGCTSVTA